ncbi:MAG: hypothetical protein JWN70_6741 [Planctomycetaceae bacterium]|nr:hypothetical protein [Planctomycetaceae bacterium]
MSSPLLITRFIKSALYDQLTNYRAESMQAGNICSTGYYLLDRCKANLANGGVASSRDAALLWRWSARHCSALGRLRGRIRELRAAHQLVIVANSDHLIPTLKAKATSVTYHHWSLARSRDASRAFSNTVCKFLHDNPFDLMVKWGVAKTAPAAGTWLSSEQTAEWNKIIESTSAAFSPFSRDDWNAAKSNIEIEHWRSVEYFVRNRDWLLESEPRVARRGKRAADPEITARDTQIFELWEKLQSPQKVWIEWNRSHGDKDQIEYSTAKKVISLQRRKREQQDDAKG